MGTRGDVYARAYFDWGGCCAYCNIKLHRIKNFGSKKLGLTRGTIDHFIPRAKGGTKARANRVLACVTCNQNKGGIDPRDETGAIVRWVEVWEKLTAINATPEIPLPELRRQLRMQFPVEEHPSRPVEVPPSTLGQRLAGMWSALRQLMVHRGRG